MTQMLWPGTTLAYNTSFVYLFKIWRARQSIEVIHFAALFLLLDIQTPSSSSISGEYNVFFFSFGENFNWLCPNFHWDCIDFYQSYLSQLSSYLLRCSVSSLRYPNSIIFANIRYIQCVLFQFSKFQFGETFNWVCPNFSWAALIFINTFFHN